MRPPNTAYAQGALKCSATKSESGNRIDTGSVTEVSAVIDYTRAFGEVNMNLIMWLMSDWVDDIDGKFHWNRKKGKFTLTRTSRTLIN